MSFLTDLLIQKGWIEIQHEWKYEKGDWEIQYDTSTWLMIGTKSNEQIFDVHNPGEFEAM
ncbi:MAG: hypothetical protein ACI8ZN_000864 [Bacteroidia bacterium]|jgi:hypothetical protein